MLAVLTRDDRLRLYLYNPEAGTYLLYSTGFLVRKDKKRKENLYIMTITKTCPPSLQRTSHDFRGFMLDIKCGKIMFNPTGTHVCVEVVDGVNRPCECYLFKVEQTICPRIRPGGGFLKTHESNFSWVSETSFLLYQADYYESYPCRYTLTESEEIYDKKSILKGAKKMFRRFVAEYVREQVAWEAPEGHVVAVSINECSEDQCGDQFLHIMELTKDESRAMQMRRYRLDGEG